jgi:excinuclease UvrABC nuclease subunit
MKNLIYDTKGRPGIYAYYKNKNDKIYVGQAVNLLNRLNDYTQPSYLCKKIIY